MQPLGEKNSIQQLWSYLCDTISCEENELRKREGHEEAEDEDTIGLSNIQLYSKLKQVRLNMPRNWKWENTATTVSLETFLATLMFILLYFKMPLF